MANHGNHQHAAGYGVLAPGAFDEVSGKNGDQLDGSAHLSVDYYGSFDNASVSTADSYNRWYDFDDEIPLYQSSGALDVNNPSIQEDYTSEYPIGTETSATEVVVSDSSYDKYEMKGTASTALVAWNIFNLLLSMSLLAFPYIFSKCGLIILPFLALIVLITTYTSRILVVMMHEKSYVRSGKFIVRLDYAELAEEVFDSRKGAIFIRVMQLLEMLATCILNICVLGRLTHEIYRKIDIQISTVIAALFALPTFFIRKLVVIGWIQTIGVISLAIGLVIIQAYCIINYAHWQISSIPIYNLLELPPAIGVIVYNFGIHSILPGLEEQMNKRKSYSKTVGITFVVSMVIQCFFGLTNAMYYGKHTDPVITIDLENQFALGIATSCFIAISILSHFSLPSFVVMEKLDTALHSVFRWLPEPSDTVKHTILTVGIRVTIMIFSVSIAVLVPEFVYLMAFFGSAITVILSLIIPCYLHIKIYGNSLPKFQLVFDVFIILFGLCLFVIGSSLSIYAMFKRNKF